MSGGISRLALVAMAAMLLGGCASKTAAPVRDATVPPPVAETAATPSQDRMFHVVQPGDTLMGISRQYGQSVADLVSWNGLSNPNQISVGQQLRVAPPEGAVAQTMAIPDTTELRPLTASPATEGPVLIEEPKGGRQPYSDQAWAALQGRPAVPAEVAAPAQTGEQGASPAAASAWVWPIGGGEILLGFEQPKGENGKLLNKGIDIGSAPGTPVLASAPGTVMYAGSGLRGFGKLVIIRHESDYQTVYAHNQALLVKEGETVTQGQKIAELGSTDADRPMLHFEIRRQGRPLDPLKYLPPR
ncbi:M23 family metallopeptidase [Thauera sp. CAU 1555]|uniref:M23 family metallopeptidase n=1 Tax=Thauera sedimentorum TaxID=2767595 RepID=A0ABR9B5K0_9RHOO|nr:M23 family metallopeptidase [Thauera sedimentorum]MBC9070735.1 M23 family metallopeptidase [Thauera sedimentorum]MBD8501654.1 M23 family metallopeptidase [Thauera sedimentorum]